MLTKLTKVPISLHKGDLPTQAIFNAEKRGIVAWDIETSGLDWSTNKIATCQILVPEDSVYIVQIDDNNCKNLKALIEHSAIIKVFHHALFDLRFMTYHWSIVSKNTVCTKIISKILKPKAEDHSLKRLLFDHLGIEIDKELCTSNWTRDFLSNDQINYAANDVIYLIDLFKKLTNIACEEGTEELLISSFDYIPARVALDLRGCGDVFTY